MKKFGVVKAKVVSVYDKCTVENECEFDLFTQMVCNVKDFDYEEDCLNWLNDRYIVLEDGTKVSEFHAVEVLN